MKPRTLVGLHSTHDRHVSGVGLAAKPGRRANIVSGSLYFIIAYVS